MSPSSARRVLRAIGLCLLTASVGACEVADHPSTEVDVPVADAGDGCPSGWSRCSDQRCYDTRTDPMHCGSCPAACGAGQMCSAGTCTLGDGGAIVDVAVTDQGGPVDVVVATDQGGPVDVVVVTDQGGPVDTSGCPASQTSCSGMCRVLSTDMDNCGSCGNRCTADQFCSSGTCQATTIVDAGTPCASGQTSCSGLCADLTNDPLNCGTCGMRCAAGEICSARICASAGDGGFLPQDSGPCAAGTVSCGAFCANTSNDPLNCGACGMRCLSTQVCTARVCVTNGTGPMDGGIPGGDGGMVPQDSGPCTGGTISCGAFCANTASDPYNCGACGNRCATGQVCQARVCTTGGGGPTDGGIPGGDGGMVPQDSGPCTGGTVSCGGFCANVVSDPTNCGACGVRCPTGQVCTARVCGTGGPIDAGTCAAGMITCSGYCANGTNDPTNCGTCGHRCADGEVCAGGSCFASNDCGTLGHPCCSSAPACMMGACSGGICR